MKKLPRPFSIQANRIETAISDGRAEDVLYELVDILRKGKADKATQVIAANWIEVIALRPGDAKALRGGRDAFPKEWLAISEMVVLLQAEGKTYAAAVGETARHFGYSERHVQKCVRLRNEATAQE